MVTLKNIKRYFIFLIITSLSITLLLSSCAGGARPKTPNTQRPKDEPVPVLSDFQEWADYNGNGELDQNEMEDLLAAVWLLLKEPHEVDTPVDQIFDLKKDGFIDNGELNMARELYFAQQIYLIPDYVPEVVPLLDLNNNDEIDEEDVGLLLDYYFYDPSLREGGHEISHPFDEKIDRNRDGFVDDGELEEASVLLFNVVSVIPYHPDLPKFEGGGMRAVDSVLAKLADLNDDGGVDDFELELLEEGLSGPHEVDSPFDERIDFNNNGRIERFEIQRAEQAAEVPVEEEDIEALPVLTPVDEIFDINKDGQVIEAEIRRYVLYFLQGGHEVVGGNKLDKIFDFNKDRFVDEEELLLARELLFRPHPVDPDRKLDRGLDSNNNDFIEPEEIGIAAGYSPLGEIPSFDEIIADAEYRMESEALPEREEEIDSERDGTVTSDDEKGLQKRLGAMNDKKLAVVGLQSSISSLDKETVDGIVVFVENAFVNTGAVKVVDRQNIEKIMGEYEFQMNQMIDEKTAVEIGKLAGSDIIVTGSVSYIGKKYYLNIKLISVETAEIIGSSIAEAKDPSEFYDMANGAVLRLF